MQSWIAWRNARQRRAHADQERIVLHFTPTSSSWPETIASSSPAITPGILRASAFAGGPSHNRALEAYLAQRNLAPKRYLWHAKGEDVLAKILRARAALQPQQNV